MDKKKCSDCEIVKPLTEFYKNESWYRKRCKKCHRKIFQPATGKLNTGRFKKGQAPPVSFEKGHVPWNKGKKGYHLKPLSDNNYRSKAFAIYDNECEGCQQKERLQVHHIDGNRLNNNKENLMIVCDTCHPRIHSLQVQGFDHYQSVSILRNYRHWQRKDSV